jgi:hypothetical protein
LLLWLAPVGLVLSSTQGAWLDIPTGSTLFTLRKEYFFYLILIGAAILLATPRFATPDRQVNIAIGTGFCLANGAMLQEGLALPATVMAALLFAQSIDGAKRRRAVYWVSWPPALAAGFAIGITPPKGPEVAAAWSTLDPATRDWLGDGLAQFPLAFLGQSAEKGAIAVHHVYLQQGVALPYVVAGLLIVGWLLAAVRLLDRGSLSRLLLLALGAGLVGFAPLFLVALDWGRWIAAIMVFAVIITLGILTQEPARARPTPVTLGSVTAAVSLAVGSVWLGIAEVGTPFPLARILLG